MVTVIGLGFVGLTTSLGLSELGYPVYGFDANSERLNSLKNKKLDFAEPDLEDQLCKHYNNSFFLDRSLAEAIQKSSFIFVCVGSPCNQDGSVDLRQVIEAVIQCLKCVPKDGIHRTIVIKSTVPPGTCKDVVEPMVRNCGYCDKELSVASNPEFLREGSCWNDFMKPGRIVIGADNQDSLNGLKTLYSSLDAPVHCVSLICAEFSKYLSNVMLASMISFANELAHAAKMFGNIDVISAFETLRNDARLKNSGIASYLYPGCGYGGYCLPKDISAFTAALNQRGYNSDFLNAVISVNDRVADRFCDEVAAVADVTETIGILGLAFKPGTDDVRDTAAARLIRGLQKKGYTSIVAYDPLALMTFQKYYSDLNVIYVKTSSEVLEQAKTIVIATAWDEFRFLDYTGKNLIDGRYMIEER